MPKKRFIDIIFKQSSPSPPRKSFSDSIMGEDIETLIIKWDPISNDNNDRTVPLFSNTRQEAKRFIDAVKSLQSIMQELITEDSSSEELVQAQFLMQVAMKRLRKEFYRILSDCRDHLDPESVSSHSFNTDRGTRLSDYDEYFSDDEFRVAGDAIVEMESVSAVAISDLKAIAECMIYAGYGRDCISIYSRVRKTIVDEALFKLGVEKLSLSQIQKMQWEVLERKIKCWLNAVKVAVRTLFPGERTLCDHVFAAPERKRAADSCFAEVCREGAATLFGFPENVAKCKKSPEKMFRTLDLYEAISENWTQIESIFSSESTSSVRSQVIASQARLAEALRAMLTDFESAIQKESSRTPVPGGAVHPLTRYVMNYIAFLADYGSTLRQIVVDLPKAPLPKNYYRSPELEESPSPEIAERLAWLIFVVLCKLDGKAKLYKDVAISYLFLANNLQYVVKKARKSDLRFLLGENWLRKHEENVNEYASKYERVGWSKVFSSLPENPLAEMPAEEASAVLQSFNAAFDEVCKDQSSWIVPDPKLRGEIKKSIALKMVSKYRQFYEANRVGSGHCSIRLPDDLENHLDRILNGTETARFSRGAPRHCVFSFS